MSRPWTDDVKTETGSTRMTVKRCCNGCGKQIGDVTRGELDAAMCGMDLPDVREECGCTVATEAEVGALLSAVFHALGTHALSGHTDDLERRLRESLARIVADREARVLRDAADEMWRIFLRLPHAPSPLGDYIQRRVLDLREHADRKVTA